MRIEILTKNYRLDEDLRALISKKLNKFDKYFDNEAAARVKLTCAGTDRYIMEVSVEERGVSVRSVAEGDMMNENIDIVLPKLERQIVKNRSRIGEKLKKSAFESPTIYSENTDIKNNAVNVVKVKKFDISVTTVENAVEEMEMLGHNFYLFVNGDNNKVCALYKRNDGDYGLIEPEY